MCEKSWCASDLDRVWGGRLGENAFAAPRLQGGVVLDIAHIHACPGGTHRAVLVAGDFVWRCGGTVSRLAGVRFYTTHNISHYFGGRMKKCFLVVPLLLLLLLPAGSQAQIPNASFENWTQTTALNPDGWITFNLTGFAVPITRSTTPHSGQYAVQGSVVNVAYVNELMPAYLYSYFGYHGRPASLNGWYQFTSAGHDSLEITVALYRNGLSEFVSSGSWSARTSTTGYTQFSIPLEYFSGLAADTAVVWVITANGDNDTVHLGTTFILDDLSFEGTVAGITPPASQKPITYALDQNYPNPFNPSTTIRFALPEAGHVRLSVYNLLGERVAMPVDEIRQAGTYDQRFDASALPSGTYFYRLEVQSTNGSQGQNFVQVKRMTLIR